MRKCRFLVLKSGQKIIKKFILSTRVHENEGFWSSKVVKKSSKSPFWAHVYTKMKVFGRQRLRRGSDGAPPPSLSTYGWVMYCAFWSQLNLESEISDRIRIRIDPLLCLDPDRSDPGWRVAKTFSAFCGHGRFQNGDAVLCFLAWPCNFFENYF